MINIIVNIAGVLLMLLVAWWFWLSKGQRKKIKDSNEITIVVDGVDLWSCFLCAI